MSILTKNKTITGEKDENFTYVELVSRELNSEVEKINTVAKRIEVIKNEIILDMKENGETNLLKTKFYDLLEKEKNNKLEMEMTKSKYEVDMELLMLANHLDKADKENKGLDLIYSMIPKINDMLSMLPEIEKCYGGERNSPFSYIAIKRALQGVTIVMNDNIPKLIKANKKVLLEKFNKRMAVVEASKNKIQTMEEKYSL